MIKGIQGKENNRESDFIALITQEQRQLLAYAYALTGNWSDAEDVLQETNKRVWKQRDDYDWERKFFPWAKTIIYYVVFVTCIKI